MKKLSVQLRSRNSFCSALSVLLTEILDQLAIGARLFDGVQILALDILDQRNLIGRSVVEFAHQRRNLVQPRALRCAPAAFAGDQLVPLAPRRAPDDDRLQQAARPDRIGKLGNRIFIEVAARLAGKRANCAHRDMLHRIASRC